jgi:hypothetical protein
MSINSLTNVEMSRARREFASAAAAAALPAALPADAVPLAEPATPPDNKVNNALTSLTKYIPTETITLYIAAVAATPAIEQITKQQINGRVVYVFFAILTPALLLLVLASKRSAEKIQPKLPQPLPWWKMAAAFIAFAVWALSVPNNPFTQGNDMAAVVAAFAAIFISLFLSLFDPIFDGGGG